MTFSKIGFHLVTLSGKIIMILLLSMAYATVKEPIFFNYRLHIKGKSMFSKIND